MARTKKDIVAAIAAEQEYLKEKVKGTQPNIYDYLGPCGYRQLEKFNFDKKSYYLKSLNLDMERVYITKESLADWVRRATQDEIFFASSDTEDASLSTVAIVGKTFDETEKFLAHGVYPVIFDYFRGCIITGIEDFNFCLCIPREYNIGALDILTRLKTFIEKYNDNVVIDDNDILIDGKKVVGMTGIKNATRTCHIIHISLTDYIDLIYELCPPHGEKEPGFISNITKKQFEEEVQSWLK